MTGITSSITYVITLVFMQRYDDRLNECHYPIGLIAQQFSFLCKTITIIYALDVICMEKLFLRTFITKRAPKLNPVSVPR